MLLSGVKRDNPPRSVGFNAMMQMTAALVVTIVVLEEMGPILLLQMRVFFPVATGRDGGRLAGYEVLVVGSESRLVKLVVHSPVPR